MKYKDYYAVMGLARGASEDDIKKSYRRLARKYHPDVSKEPDAEEKFKDVAEAYQTLKDPEKRAAYDQLGQRPAGEEFQPPPDWRQQWQGGGAGPGGTSGGSGGFGPEGFSADDLDLSDLFAHLRAGRAGGAGPGFGAQGASGAMPGQDYEIPVQISIEDAFHGTEINLDLSMPEYDDQGRLRRVPRAFTARVPKGATDGQRLRVPGKGGKGFNGGRNGDLYLDIALKPHSLYRVSGHDLYMDLALTPWEAVLGTSVEVTTPGGVVRLKVPAGTQAGRQLRLPHRGLPIPKGEQGDLYAVVEIAVPSVVNDKERALYEQLAGASSFDPRAKVTGDSDAR